MSEQNHEQSGQNPEYTADSATETETGTTSPEASESGDASPEAASGDAAALAEELAREKDKNLRLYAEFDNFRRRTAKESFDMMATANAKLVEKMCEVLENFGRAFEAQGKGTPEDFEKGVRLIYGRFKEILDGEGLEEIDPVGTEFDPNLHDALLQQASDTVPENHVVQVISKGFKLKSKILKHAKVIVSTGPQG